MSDNTDINHDSMVAEQVKLDSSAKLMEATKAKHQSRSSYDEVVNLLENGFESLELSDDDFTNLFDTKIQTIKEDELVKGKIVQLSKDEVFVDIGFKSLGVVPRAELLNAETYQIGDEIRSEERRVREKCRSRGSG